ncbi:hypothetical protein F4809DRAFT_635529 [Biscogniauxia mediterranea]|nr:hypothetical protein F4809DRAFT_635529 [Biscogniauxia mediterranea]
MQDPAAPKPTRTLFKGRLKAPAKTPSPSSYTLGPVPNPNITVRTRADKRTTRMSQNSSYLTNMCILIHTRRAHSHLFRRRSPAFCQPDRSGEP